MLTVVAGSLAPMGQTLIVPRTSGGSAVVHGFRRNAFFIHAAVETPVIVTVTHVNTRCAIASFLTWPIAVEFAERLMPLTDWERVTFDNARKIHGLKERVEAIREEMEDREFEVRRG